MSPEDHNKRLVYRCHCGSETVRRIALTPTEARPFAECGCGTPIDWSGVPVEDHTLYVTDLVERIRRGDFPPPSE